MSSPFETGDFFTQYDSLPLAQSGEKGNFPFVSKVIAAEQQLERGRIPFYAVIAGTQNDTACRSLR